ncbi:hypothetical protein PPYR_06146 [Photinus pyralis]|uniref:Uncharacterized protein n=1 Tax=Photinus pyralis TaxID=7054 RepID=A0A5N4ASW5_PHOPY|nr:hypothetical protein PPYR_06146 [Photinus pyralis]
MNSNVDFLLRAFENGMFSNDGIVKAYHQVLDLIVSGVRLSTEDVARYNDLRAAAQAIYQRDNNETPSTASASVDNEASARHPQPVTENIGSGIAVRRPLDSEDYKYLEIVSEGSRLIKKYNTMSTNLLFKFKSEHKLEAPIVWLEDVTILRKACVEFWKRFTSENGVDPFRECCTIAGACSLVFRRNFLQENTIGLIPNGGYRMADKQSRIAIQWLLWLEHSEGVRIQHTVNSREVRLREGILVDGFSPETNTVYQFHGCYYHGCEMCYKYQGENRRHIGKDTFF